MCLLIENIANDKGMNVADANFIYKFIAAHLCSKIPALRQVIEDAFENADDNIFQEHINKAVQLIQQQQWKIKFKDCKELPPTYVDNQNSSGGELF